MLPIVQTYGKFVASTLRRTCFTNEIDGINRLYDLKGDKF